MPQPTNNGIPPFHSDEFEPSNPEDAYFHIIPVPWETSVSYGGGTANGPAAILRASTQLEAYLNGSTPGDAGIYTAPFVDCDEDAEGTLDRIQESITRSLKLSRFPITLGGEHSISLAPIRALKSLGVDFGVVQFDAHADLRDSYQGNPFSHACVMKRVRDLGVPIFQVGVRSLCVEEVETREAASISFLDAKEIASSGLPETLLPASFPQNIYLSFDVDGLDPSIMPSTGTPEPGGLDWYTAIEGIEKAIHGRTVVGADVVELAPSESHHASDFTASKLVYTIMDLVLRNG